MGATMGVNDINLQPLLNVQPHSGRWRLWLTPALASVDALMVLVVVFTASPSYHGVAYGHVGNPGLTMELAGFIAAIFVFTNLIQGRYRIANYLSSEGQMIDAFNVWNIAMIAFIAVAFMAKVIDEYSRGVVLLTYVLGVPGIALARRALTQGIVSASRSGRIATERVLIIGTEAKVLDFVSRYRPWNIGFVIVDAAFIREAPEGMDAAGREARLAADLGRAQARVRALQPDSVFIAMAWSQQDMIERCVQAFMTVPVAIHLVPEAIMERFRHPRIAKVGALSSLQLTRAPLTMVEVLVKRAFDVMVATIALVLLSPLMLLISLALRIESKGPVLFAQRRYGFNQQTFRIFKFRTMTTSEDGPTIVQATRDDPRVTRVGRILRRYNLDELPQLVNVLTGQMSLVGPRPHALAHDHEYEEKISLYARRHNVKPGITGWAQVHGLRGLTDSDDKMRSRVDHDLWYIDNWSLWLDVVILLRTVFSARSFRNAF
jgi:Undecaprenyl-phosphate glucose phosphotransferase